MTFTVESDGPHAMADQDVCIAVGETLQQAYPNYPWMVGVAHEAGTAVIDLPEAMKPLPLKNWGYLLHLKSLMGPDGQKKVLAAGGELLERLGLPRETAPFDYKQRALEHGMDTENAVIKSKGSTV